MSNELDKLIAEARLRPPMSEEERFAQAVSFAYGNLAIDQPNTSRAFVKRVQTAMIYDLQIQDALREVGYKPWFEDRPGAWKNPAGEGAYLTHEALYIEWQNALARAGRADARVESVAQTMLGMAVWLVALFSIILYLLTR